MKKILYDYGKIRAKINLSIPMLRKITHIIAKCDDEGVMTLNANKLFFSLMDTCHIVYAYASIDQKDCNHYELMNGSEFQAQMSLKTFRSLILSIPCRKTTRKTKGKNEMVDIEIFEHGMRIILENKKGSLYFQFESKIDDERVLKELTSKFSFDYTFTIQNEELMGILKMLSVYSDNFLLSIQDYHVIFQSNSDGHGVTQELNDIAIKTNQNCNDIQSRYGVSFFKYLCNKSMGKTQMFTFKITDDSPNFMSMAIGDNSVIEFMIAPQVNDDDNN